MMLLVTRPVADAAPIVAQLESAGHEVVVESVIEIRRLPDVVPDLDGVSGLIFTSANGVRAFAEARAERNLPVFAVGEHTAEAAREAGFSSVEHADADGEALVALVRERWKPEDGALLYPGPTEPARDVAGALREAGYDVRSLPIYEAVPVPALSAGTRDRLKRGTLDGVLFFSPRSAGQFVALLNAARLQRAAAKLLAFCLSPAVAEALADVKFADVRVAPEPTREALLQLLPAPAPARRQRRRSPLRAVVLALLIVGIAISSTWWWPFVSPYADRVSQLVAQIGGNRPEPQTEHPAPASTPNTEQPAPESPAPNAEQAAPALNPEPARSAPPPPAPNADTGPTSPIPEREAAAEPQRLDQLQGEIDALNKRLGETATKADIDALRSQAPAAAAGEPPPDQTQLSALEQEVSSLKNATAGLATKADVESVRQQVSAPAAPSGAPDQRQTEALGQELQALKAEIGGLASKSDLENLRQQISAPAASGETGDQAQLAPLVQQLQSLKQQLAGLPSKSDLDALRAQAAASSAAEQKTSSRLDALDASVVKLRDAAGGAVARSDLDPIRQAVDALSKRLDALPQQPAGEEEQVAALVDQVKQQGAAVASLQARLEQHQKDTTAAHTLVLASAEITAAVGSSTPYAAPLRAVEALGMADPDVANAMAVLERDNGSEPPSRAALEQQLADLSGAGPSKTGSERPASAGFWNRVTSGITGLVKVQRTDQVGSEGAKAIEAARHALAAGDLSSAITQMEAVDAAQAKAWVAAARARLELEQAARSLQAAAIRLLAQASAEQP